MEKFVNCPMEDEERGWNPENREIAFAFQFHKIVWMLWTCAHQGPKEFEAQLKILEGFINGYRELRGKI